MLTCDPNAMSSVNREARARGGGGGGGSRIRCHLEKCAVVLTVSHPLRIAILRRAWDVHGQGARSSLRAARSRAHLHVGPHGLGRESISNWVIQINSAPYSTRAVLGWAHRAGALYASRRDQIQRAYCTDVFPGVSVTRLRGSHVLASCLRLLASGER